MAWIFPWFEGLRFLAPVRSEWGKNKTPPKLRGLKKVIEQCLLATTAQNMFELEKINHTEKTGSCQQSGTNSFVPAILCEEH
jgi:hypothetical protein